MSAFTGTAAYYGRFRPGVPQEIAALLDRVAPASSPRRLLDIGTGPGLVVTTLLPFFDDVIALDPDADMLTSAEAILGPHLTGGRRLELHHGGAEDFTPPPGWQPQLVTFCRVFHWLDKARVLSRLSQYVAPDGVLAVFSDRSLWTAGNPWQQAVREVVQDFLGEERRAGEQRFGPPGLPYEQLLRASVFSDVTETLIPVCRRWTVDQVIGYLYSTSFAAPPLFAGRREEFESALTAVLADFTVDGTLTEDNAFTVLTARRPSAGSR